ncbi:LOW QUALITY PROTEIN: hypothetical protein CVT26_011933 [Gymnopilus dilepis]|uniref:F-box domain-containing protein n=1 Tax=Gymnopilus dilepis TaxID=231916 RepID=A0A409W969_9AGAR|nr:LOW QUALITY PROTEIN: hypothetical protein CVT26_011933 [Gymnopilus dilepis]
MRAGCEGPTTVIAFMRSVCKQWGDIASGVPEMWSRMDIIVTATNYEDGFANKVQHVRERMQSALTISIQPICTRRELRSAFSASHLRPLGQLLEAVERFIVTHHRRLPPVVKQHRMRAYPSPPEPRVVTTTFRATLQGCSSSYQMLPSSITRPWACTLTSLTVRCSLDGALQLGQFYPKLECLRPRARSLPNVPLSLVIDGKMRVLRHFDVPSLESLVLLNPDRGDSPLHSLIEFMDRTSCNLRALGVDFDVEALRTILCRMGNLYHLYIWSNRA